MCRHLLRFAFSGLCLLSLLACGGTGWLEFQSRRGSGARVCSAARAGARYTVRAEGGRFVLYAPPAAVTAGPGSTADAVSAREASSLRNDDIFWFILVAREGRQAGGMRASPLVRNPTFFALLSYTRNLPGADRALLWALEDPDRFAAAHVALVLREVPLWEVSAAPGGRGVRATYDGMMLDLRPGEIHDTGSGPQYYQDVLGPWVDQARLPALREQWHRRLDAAVGSIALRRVLEVMALPPGLWLALRSRRALVLRRRRRLGLCRRCGYDLTGNTSGWCSECGEAVSAEASA